MANMGYCRFYNTKADLEDCLEALNENRTLSNEEFKACKQMFGMFIEFCVDEGIIEDEDGELDERLEDFLESIEVE